MPMVPEVHMMVDISSFSLRAQRFVEVDMWEPSRKAHRMWNEKTHPAVRERIGNRADRDPPRHVSNDEFRHLVEQLRSFSRVRQAPRLFEQAVELGKVEARSISLAGIGAVEAA